MGIGLSDRDRQKLAAERERIARRRAAESRAAEFDSKTVKGPDGIPVQLSVHPPLRGGSGLDIGSGSGTALDLLLLAAIGIWAGVSYLARLCSSTPVEVHISAPGRSARLRFPTREAAEAQFTTLARRIADEGVAAVPERD
ncbi:hypothetical protein AB0M43_27825 [Longispora sp. NPDC051575]|uniref:hypothetical protein n=1 Tax=Longispora sp. NPDC051575 TaxID=3154943 RepID=UPI00341BB35D